MEPSRSQQSRSTPCDYKPLQECLLKNNNDRSKCVKEWDDFQQACRKQKQQDCEACQKQ
ncbi:hypothetical protein DM01DRAFT_1072234 [Hesseltinella vesiculosa]|uniref:CHCH domain-containing protein n=1 Tax=Hesseltinella vesiculosa TaxID=101127 RepID=A0A1X2GVN2_9FUNG|nr:hypothetical protein DM01DRAFT_1072234 [Hesseltinella vesiculosa]